MDLIDNNLDDELPLGRFEAPRFSLTKRENHGFGYHSHLQKFTSGKYKRTGYVITLYNGIYYAFEHGNIKLFDLGENKNAVLRDIEDYIKRVFKGIPKDELLMPSPSDNLIYLMNQ